MKKNERVAVKITAMTLKPLMEEVEAARVAYKNIRIKYTLAWEESIASVLSILETADNE